MENISDWISQIFHNGAKIIREDGSVLTGPHLQAALHQRRDDPELCRSGVVSELILQQLAAMVYGKKFLGYGARPGDPHEPENIQNWDWVCYTSGTTGYYKAHGHTWTATQKFADTCAEQWKLDNDSVLLNNFPYGSMGIYSTTWPTLIAGGTVLCKTFNPYAWVSDIVENRVTHGVMVPRQAQLVSQTKAFENADLSCVKSMNFGANFVNKKVIDLFADRGMGWHHVYGSTELFGPICLSDDTEVLKNFLPGFEYRVGDDGEFIAKWDSQDTWVHTGDLVVEREPGVLKMIGRKNFMFKHRDTRIQPEHIETIAKYVDTITECIALVEDDKLTLKYEGTTDVALLKETLQKHLDPLLMPSRFVQVEELPRSSMGKLIRPRQTV